MPTSIEIEQEDPREKTANEVEDLFHNAGRIARTAIMSDDAKVKQTLKTAIRTLADQAIVRLDESVGASVADDEED